MFLDHEDVSRLFHLFHVKSLVAYTIIGHGCRMILLFSCSQIERYIFKDLRFYRTSRSFLVVSIALDCRLAVFTYCPADETVICFDFAKKFLCRELAIQSHVSRKYCIIIQHCRFHSGSVVGDAALLKNWRNIHSSNIVRNPSVQKSAVLRSVVSFQRWQIITGLSGTEHFLYTYLVSQALGKKDMDLLADCYWW